MADERLPGYIKLDSVTCRRGRLGEATYDAEVVLHHTHYFISSGHTDYKEAKAAAQKVIDEIEPALLECGRTLLSQYPEAKE